MTGFSHVRATGAVIFAFLVMLSPMAAAVPTPTGSVAAPASTTQAATTVNVTGSVFLADGSAAAGDSITAYTQDSSVTLQQSIARIAANGSYSVPVAPGESYALQYVQGHPNDTGAVLPRDGSPDIYPVGRVNTSADTFIGLTQLPTGYVVDVQVVDGSGNPLEGIPVTLVATNSHGMQAGWSNVTRADGHIYPNQVDPGLELNGSVRVTVLPPSEYESPPITRELTVSESTNVTITLGEEAPPGPSASGDLTVSEPVVAGFTPANFTIENETGVQDGDRYHWSFGNELGDLTTAPNNSTSHRYRQPGEYVASVQVFRNGTEQPLYTDSVPVTVLPAGTADLVATPAVPNASETVDFTLRNVSLGVDANVSFYSWNFGDGSGDFTQAPNNSTSHAYAEAGTYTARVTAYDGTERLLFTATREVVVGEGDGGNEPPATHPPSVVLGVNETTVRVGDPVRLDGSDSFDPDGTITEYRWDVDDDGTADRTTSDLEDSIVHAYRSAGTHTARLTVVDNDTLTNSTTRTITVLPTVTATGGEWPQFHYDTANGGYNASASAPAPPVTSVWNTSVRAAEPHAPVVWNGLVVSTEDPNLLALNASTGGNAWSTSLYPADYAFSDRFDLTSAPTVVDGVAYIGAFWEDESAGTVHERVYAVDATTGTELWNVSYTSAWGGFFDDGITVAEPKVADGTVVVTSAVSDRVVAIDANTQAVLWSDDLQSRHDSEVVAPPTISDGRVFVTQGWSRGGARGYLYAFDLTTGNHLWNASLGFNYDGAAVAAADGVVYVARDGVPTVAYHAANGTQQWSGADSYVGADGSAAVTDSLVIVGKGYTADRSAGLPGGVRALDRDTGDLVWSANTTGVVTGAPAVAGNEVVFATTNGTVHSVALSTGTEHWRYKLPDVDDCEFNSTSGECEFVQVAAPVVVAPAVVDGVVYLRVGTNSVTGRELVAIGQVEASGTFDADLTVSPQPAYANATEVTLGLANESGTAPASYEWTFGDGTTARTTHPDADVTHVYDRPGTYTVRVVARDGSGAVLFSDQATVTVSRPTGDLVANPPKADVNVTNVTFRLESVTGVTPTFYTWDLDGDGQFEDSGSVPVTNYTYEQLLGLTDARVVAWGDGETVLFEATTRINVTDRIPPVANATASAAVDLGAEFTVNASNSTDNHRVAGYTFTPDSGSPVSGSSPTANLSFGTSGSHTVDVTVRDPTGNENTTTLSVFVRDVPDLVVNVTAPATQRLSEGANATVTVTNNGTATAASSTVRLNATARVSYYESDTHTVERSVGDLAPGESATLDIDVTEWAEANVTSSRPRVGLVATADAEDAVDEGNERNNVAEAETEVGYSDIRAYLYVPYNSLPSEPHPVRLTFVNTGNIASPTHTAEVAFGDGSPNEIVTVPSLDRRERYETTVSHTFELGSNPVVVNVTDDPLPAGNFDRDHTRTEQFDFELRGPSAPDEVVRNETFYVYAWSDTNYRSNLSTTIELPDGLELVDGEPVTQNGTRESYESFSWEVRAVNLSNGTPYDIGVTGTARGETQNGTTQVSVVVPKLRVQNASSVSLSDDDSATVTLDIRNETTFDHEVSVSAQLGPAGRTLAGLDYLFDYPHGCVEQTASPLLTALNTDQYYRSNSAPGGYDEAKTDGAIAVGVSRLTTGENAQHDNGAWSMWGNDPRGDMYYTAYALFATSSVRNDGVQGARAGVASDLSQADFNATVLWLEANQETDGRLANDKYYFEDDMAMTGFALAALDRAEPYNATASAAADRIRVNATAYLVSTQRADGSWGDGEANGMSTAVAVWGLARSGVDTPAVNDAIEDGVAWLLANQEADGAWSEDRSSSWRSTGTASETTGYALLALNETGIPADNETITRGTSYLVGVYDTDGSWGYTRASAVAIEALLTLDTGATSPSQTATVSFGTATNPSLVTKTVSVDDATPQATVRLTDAELATLRGTGPPIQVTIDSTGVGQLVIGIENDQLVNADEYAENTGGD
ncbi:PKD domain-containing protein [Natronomonas sp. EA1]|uniref:PKD domain-containing protein n=1 Tax=Natronomonas sp. EA1 TaxID=3421655 RepID=UPI003EBF2DD3